MKNILIIGATGNIGFQVIRYLFQRETDHRIVAGVRNIEKAKSVLYSFTALRYVGFDFENFSTFSTALEGIDSIFIVRPPHISDVDTYFKPLISAIKSQGVKEIVFLSVQGAEKSKIIPHNKIERLIIESGIDYIFLRPSYFMQNLSTTLLPDIQLRREIVLPSSKAKFNWIDIDNIGEVGAILLEKFAEYKNKAYEITGQENESFETVVKIMNEILMKPIRFRSVNPFSFYLIKKRSGLESGMIIVMALLHFLPRFQPEPAISDFYKRLTGKNPTNLKSFIEREKMLFE